MAAAGCICTFGPYIPTVPPSPWVVTAGPVHAGKITCKYRRAGSATQSCTGTRLLTGAPCATSCPATTTGEEYASEDVVAPGPCGAAPDPSTPTNFVPTSACD